MLAAFSTRVDRRRRRPDPRGLRRRAPAGGRDPAAPRARRPGVPGRAAPGPRAQEGTPRPSARSWRRASKPPQFVREVRVEGPGYLNIFLDRSRSVALLLSDPLVDFASHDKQKIIVEHTNINPNKAAHIGHLRNAVLGDTLVRLLRALGPPVEVQNYIDDTGVQVADLVVGFLDLRGLETSARDRRPLPEPLRLQLLGPLRARYARCYEEDAEPPAAARRDPARHGAGRRAAAPRPAAVSRAASSAPPGARWRGSASATTCCPTRATSSGSTSGTGLRQLQGARRDPPRDRRARTPAAG